MPTTTPWNIQYPDGDSAITPLQDRFYELANTTNSAINTAKASLDGDISTLSTSVSTINSRLALNLQEGSGTPSGAPSNSGHEGSMYWDYTNDIMYVRSGTNWYPVGAKMPSFNGKLAGTLSSSNGVKKTITFDSKVERGMTESAGIVTVNNEGWYSINGQASWESATAATRDLIIATGVSGTYSEQTITRGHMTATGSFYLNVSAQVYLSAGNTIRLQATQYTGTVNLTGATVPCGLTVKYLGM